MPDELPDTFHFPLPDGLDYPLVRVRPGAFIMGSEGSEAWLREKPEHLVLITKDYYIGVFPVIQTVWKALMDGHNPSRFKGDKRPVEGVSWIDIAQGGQDEMLSEAFLTRINRIYPIENPALAAFRFRLPTEAEWEYAAKGGHLSASPNTGCTPLPKTAELYYLYAGSDKLKEVSWYGANSHEETKAVGMKQPNELGLCDMSGNVWEWCQDWFSFDYYKTCAGQGEVVDPTGPDKASSRTVRGGGWNANARDCRHTIRNTYSLGHRSAGIGFRLVFSR